MNETLLKFGFPDMLVKDYNHWLTLLRPKQVTLGSLVTVCKENARNFSNISNEAFFEYRQVIRETEKVLFELFRNDKINYLMLMMVDPDVHFHIIPRYSREIIYNGVMFEDASWPGMPDLYKINDLNTESLHKLRHDLYNSFKKV